MPVKRRRTKAHARPPEAAFAAFRARDDMGLLDPDFAPDNGPHRPSPLLLCVVGCYGVCRRQQWSNDPDGSIRDLVLDYRAALVAECGVEAEAPADCECAAEDREEMKENARD